MRMTTPNTDTLYSRPHDPTKHILSDLTTRPPSSNFVSHVLMLTCSLFLVALLPTPTFETFLFHLLIESGEDTTPKRVSWRVNSPETNLGVRSSRREHAPHPCFLCSIFVAVALAPVAGGECRKRIDGREIDRLHRIPMMAQTSQWFECFVRIDHDPAKADLSVSRAKKRRCDGTRTRTHSPFQPPTARISFDGPLPLLPAIMFALLDDRDFMILFPGEVVVSA